MMVLLHLSGDETTPSKTWVSMESLPNGEQGRKPKRPNKIYKKAAMYARDNRGWKFNYSTPRRSVLGWGTNQNLRSKHSSFILKKNGYGCKSKNVARLSQSFVRIFQPLRNFFIAGLLAASAS
jgi:hypothetical protein